MFHKLKPCCDKFEALTCKVQCLALLFARIVVGFVFATAGWGKLNNLEGVIGFFTQLGIPAPQIQAPFVAGLEFVGGLMIVAGLFTKLISIPLLFTMIVAIATAKASEITGIGDLFGLSEFLYIVIFAIFITHGPGKASFDHWMKNRCCKE